MTTTDPTQGIKQCLDLEIPKVDAPILENSILDIFLNQKTNTEFITCTGYVKSLSGSATLEVTNNRTTSHHIYFEYLWVQMKKSPINSNKRVLMINNWKRQTKNSFVRDSSKPYEDYCVLDSTTTYHSPPSNTLGTVNYIQDNVPPTQKMLIEDIMGKFSFQADSLNDIDPQAFDLNSQESFSIFIRFYLDFFDERNLNPTDCTLSTNQYIKLTLSFKNANSITYSGWLGICVSSLTDLFISVNYKAGDPFRFRLLSSFNRVWNDLSIFFDNSGVRARISANLTSLSAFRDLSIYYYNQIGSASDGIVATLITDASSNQINGYIQSDRYVFLLLNFIGFYKGNILKKIKDIYNSYKDITIVESTLFKYPYFID